MLALSRPLGCVVQRLKQSFRWSCANDQVILVLILTVYLMIEKTSPGDDRSSHTAIDFPHAAARLAAFRSAVLSYAAPLLSSLPKAALLPNASVCVPGMFDGQAEIAVEIEASVKSYISLKAVISVVTGVLVRMRH